MSRDHLERSPSTGGLPPVKIREQYIVEQVPSHDSTPCYTAWVRKEIVQVPQGWTTSDFNITNERPQWSVQIYDTTPQSADTNHLKTLAETLHEETREERDSDGRGQPDRIDVWGMPFSADAPEEDRIAKCKAHILAQIATRETSRDGEFHVPELRSHDLWKRAIIIIDQPKESWNENEGGFLAVYWEHHPSYLKMLAQAYGEDHREPDTRALRYTRDELGQVLGGLTISF